MVAQDIFLVFANASNQIYPDWCAAAFNLPQFKDSRGAWRLVQIEDSDAYGNFKRVSLAQWVTSVNANLRGNTRGALYFDVAEEWQRLQTLLDGFIEVQTFTLLSRDFSSNNSAQQCPVHHVYLIFSPNYLH